MARTFDDAEPGRATDGLGANVHVARSHPA